MSSLTRRLQIRILKSKGYVRQTHATLKTGQLHTFATKGRENRGHILNNDGGKTALWPTPA